MNTHSGRSKFKNFRIILDSKISSTIVMDKLTSKLKSKGTAVNYVRNQTWEVHGL